MRLYEGTKQTDSKIFLNPDKMKIAVLDIEATGLTGEFHLGLCAVIKTHGKKDFHMFRLDDHDLLFETDLQEAEYEMLRDIKVTLEEEYDGVITYYGSNYDIPMLRTRMIAQGIDPLGKIKHLDMYYTARRTLRLSSNRMANVNELFKRTNKNLVGKTRIGPEYWQSAIYSKDTESMNYIADHCKRDVIVLENITNELKNFVPEKIKRM